MLNPCHYMIKIVNFGRIIDLTTTIFQNIVTLRFFQVSISLRHWFSFDSQLSRSHLIWSFPNQTPRDFTSRDHFISPICACSKLPSHKPCVLVLFSWSPEYDPTLSTSTLNTYLVYALFYLRIVITVDTHAD